MLPYIAFMDPMGLLANHPMTRYPTLALPPSERRNGPGQGRKGRGKGQRAKSQISPVLRCLMFGEGEL